MNSKNGTELKEFTEKSGKVEQKKLLKKQVKKPAVGPASKDPEMNTSIWKKLNPLESVGVKLFLFFFVSIVAFVAFVGIFAYNMSKTIIKDEVSTFSEIATVQTGDKLEMMHESLEAISSRFVIDDTYQKAFSTYLATTENSYERILANREIDSLLQTITFQDSRIYSVKLFDLNGKMLHAVGAGTVTEGDVSEEQWFQQTIENAGRTNWIPTAQKGVFNNGTPTFGFSRLVRSLTTGQTMLVVAVEVNYSEFQYHMASLDLGERGDKLIINGEGQILYADDISLVGTESSIKIPSNGDVLEERGSEVISDEGEDVLASYSRASQLNDWYVLTKVPVAELVASANQIFNMTRNVIIIAALVAIAVGYYMMFSIGRPLVNLRNLMREGEKGNLAVRTKINSKDEIGQVGITFNNMMEQITSLVEQTNHSAEEVLTTATELANVSRNTAMSAKEISMATEQIASGATNLAMQAEKGNEITIEIGDQMSQVVNTNLELGTSAGEVLEVSEQGTEYMTQLIAKTNATEEMTRSMVEKVNHLKESTVSIRQILEMLDNITKQTNILSLNAAIEAARAGAAGRGFMVVADEIRKLADQSRQSIDVVGQITETIQTEIDETVNVLSEAYPLFQEQIESVKETDLIFNKVRDQMGGFIAKLDEVTQSIQDLDQSQQILSDAIANVSSVSEEASATSEEVASLTTQQQHSSDGLVELSAKLEELSKSLKDSLSRFTF